MSDAAPFDTAAERIRFSEAVDFIEQGSPELVDPPLVDDYLRRGLLRRDAAGRLEPTDEGLRQHRIARGERFTDG